MKKILIIKVIILLPFFMYSQEFLILGEIQPKKRNFIESLEGNLLSVEDSLFLKSINIDKKGKFSINQVKGSYILQIKRYGEVLYEQNIDLFENYDLGEIYIRDTKEIQNIVIEGRVKPIEKKIDRLVYNVENSISSTGNTALETIQNAPQIHVKEDEGIYMIGKGAMQVMIDDRVLELSGKELNDYLKTIPSENIKSIEIITNPPAKYDAAGIGGLVNIKLKKTKKNSWNIALYEGYKQASYATNNGGANFNYNKNKLVISSGVNYNVGDIKNINHHRIYYPDEFWKEEEKYLQKVNNFSGRLGLDYYVNPKLLIGANYYYSHYNLDKKGGALNFITGKSEYDLIDNHFYSNFNTDFHKSNVHAVYSLDTLKRKLNIDINYFNYDQESEKSFVTDFLNNQNINNSNTNASTDGSQKINNYSILLDMEHPTYWFNFNYGVKMSFTETKNKLDFHGFSIDELIPSIFPIKDNFIYKENNQAAYISGNRKIGDNFEFKVGLRLESTQTEGRSLSLNEVTKKDYVKLFPTAYISYMLKENKYISIDYSRRIQRPGFSLLNPFKWYSSPYMYSVGNPNLEPSFSHNLEFSYTGKQYSFSLYYTRNQDQYSSITILNDKDKIQEETYLKSYNSDSWGVKQFYTFYAFKCWESINNFNLYYSEYISFLPFVTNARNIGWKYYISTDNTVYLNKNKSIAFNLHWFYTSKGVDQMDIGSSSNGLDLAVKMFLLDKKLQITLKGNDIFASNRTTWTSFTNNIKQTYNWYNDKQSFQLSILYKIGNNKLRQNVTKENQEEENRIN